MKTQIESWLKSQQPVLDRLIADAARSYYQDNKSQANFEFDLKECHSESYNLVQGKDLCYDRPNTAFAYSLWYHGRRINTFLSYFLDKFIERREQQLNVFDLGAGTGAIQWALGLIYQGFKALGHVPPSVNLINVDSSPGMLYYNRDFLWEFFVRQYPNWNGDSVVDYEVNTWSNADRIEIVEPIVAGSYLFDVSDNQAEVIQDFQSIMDRYKPQAILLLTSDQPEKRKLMGRLSSSFINEGYQEERKESNSLLLGGKMENVNLLRSELASEFDIS